VSIAGKRQGLAGERSGLWYEFARIIDELEPQWVVIENVPGLLSVHKGKDFAVIIRWLAERGYGVAWRILDAQYFGVPQRRRRVFIVGSFANGCASQILFERESSSGDTPPSREKGEGVAAPIKANSPSRRNGGSDPTADEFIIANTISTNPANRLSGEDNYVAGTLHNGFPGRDASDAADNKLITWNWQSGGDVRFDFNEKPMLQASQVPAVGVRRLTPTECERLQGFPDGWTDGQSDSTRYRQLGNAVAVPVIEWIGRRIMQNERI
jgi:DNA (cytosine-5)-methyltransferase 1